MSEIERFDGIVIKGAREHNLKNVNLKIPRNKITVLTGLSGSGKSSLAFDTIYAEGQRRYVESLSAYARNFLEQLKKPEVDSITGLSPAISIEQKTASLNPRSTVGTVTEVYDYMRLLFARVGVPHCPRCKVEVKGQTEDQILDDVLSMSTGLQFHVVAPVARQKKGEFAQEIASWLSRGYTKAKIDGELVDLSTIQKLKKTKPHNIDLVVDRIILKSELTHRLRESIQNALRLANGIFNIETPDGKLIKSYSLKASCPKCGFSFPEIEPRIFSFNNPRGACEACNGLGHLEEYVEGEDEDDVEVVYEECGECQGTRLRIEPLNIFIDGKNISHFASHSISDLKNQLAQVEWGHREKLITDKILQQIYSRLDYLDKVGVHYLSLDRPIHTLSGGEAQRVRLATQIGSSLIGVLYVLDEPSIGLHPRDHHKLLGTLKSLQQRGNTILLVEHDEDTIRMADFIVDIGPRAGKLGGEIVSQGSINQITQDKNSLTGQYLSGKKIVSKKRTLTNKASHFIKVRGATGNNLKNLDLSIPIGYFNVVTGVSGSGKSTLIIDTFYRILSQHFNRSSVEPEPFKEISGLEHVDKVVEINQRPIGRTPRSNPATYVGLFSLIRELFAQHPESKIRGYKPGRFSFNVKGGRCEACLGAGVKKIEMHFLPDVFVPCDVCMGQRYNRETLNIKYKGKSISDVLNMSVIEALEFFENHALIKRKLETLHLVGLDYITLGQNSTTLSGGEAQRVKLSKELSKASTGRTVYILDEPTTGLHFEDVKKLIELLQSLVDHGNTVVVIEHNLDVIASADHVIDLGPEGGTGGGYIVAEGMPEQIARIKKSYTGQFLAKFLK